MKRISIIVIGAHVTLLLWMALWMPVTPVKKKQMAIRIVREIQAPVMEQKTIGVAQQVAAVAAPAVAPPTVKQEFPAPSPLIKQESMSTKKTLKSAPAKKKEIKKTAPQKTAQKKPLVPQNLIAELQENIAKIEQKSHKGVVQNGQIALPKFLTGLTIDQGSVGGGSNYVGSLIDCLQGALDLPEVGAVKVELKLAKDGSFTQVRVLQAASKLNRQFLERELPKLNYPPFDASLKNEKEHAFVITFCNE